MNDYRRFMHQCLKSAWQTKDPEKRKLFQELARTWLKAALEYERNLAARYESSSLIKEASALVAKSKATREKRGAK